MRHAVAVEVRERARNGREQPPGVKADLQAPDESYALTENRILECSKHPSVQRLARRVAAFGAIPPHP